MKHRSQLKMEFPQGLGRQEKQEAIPPAEELEGSRQIGQDLENSEHRLVLIR